MANYNALERLAARFLSSSPLVKKIVKRIYQVFNYYINKPNFLFSSKFDCLTVDIGTDESFFGYYDKSPKRGDLTLYQTTEHETKKLPFDVAISGGTVKVKVLNEKTGKVIYSKQTSAFNWQQGSKLQWIDSHRFMYNNSDHNGRPYSIVSDLLTGEDKKLENPVYDAFKCQYYLSLNYLPLTKLRPDYAYFSRSENEIDYDNQYIRVCDFDGGCNDVISVVDLNNKFPLAFSCDFNQQKFNHIMISPDGGKFVFLHRAYTVNGQRIDRLFVGAFDESRNSIELNLISDSGVISHYCWKDNVSLISYMKHNGVMGYYDVKLKNSSIITKIEIDKLDSLGDGHPTWIGNGKFITDTYPDKSRMKKLLLVDLNNSSFEILAQFFEPLNYDGQTRCDLHPKWDVDSKTIFVESVHDGRRKLYKIGPIHG